jgi:hypothetical protein
MKFLDDVAKIGLSLVLAAIILFFIPIVLLQSCHFTVAMSVTFATPLILLFIAFHPKVLALIGAIDVLSYFLTSMDERKTKFSGTVIRTYMRYVMLSISVSTTSLTRQMLSMQALDQDFSFVGLALPFYLIIVRKHLFGGNMEEYLAKYVQGSLLICLVGAGFAAFFVPNYFDPSVSCRIRHALEARP